MLNKIRNASHHYLFKLLFCFLAVIFAVGLIDFSYSKHHIAATVGKQEISLSDFLQARQESINKLNQKQYLTSEQAQLEAKNINNDTITKLVTQNLVKQEAEHLGIRISPETIAEYIQKDENFHKEGSFDLEHYKKVLTYNNLKEEQLITLLSHQIASKFLLDSLIVNLPLKQNLSNYLYDYLAEKRSISLITIDANNTKVNNVSEQELKDYYQKNPNNFQTKEYRDFDYILLSSKDIKITTETPESELEKEYAENKEVYSLPETRDFYHFLAPDEKIAEQIIAALKTNADQTKVAKDFVNKKVISESFSNQPAHSFLSNIDPSLFTLKEHDITSIVKSDLGWHVFKIMKIHPKQYKSFAEAKKEIKENLHHKMAEVQLYELSKTIEDDLASGAELTEVAKRNNLPLIKMKQVAIDDKEKANLEIINLAFKMAVKEDSPLTPIADGKDYVVVHVEAIELPKLKEFKEVEEQIKESYKMQMKDELALELARALQTELSKDKQTLVLSGGKDYQLNDDLVKTLLNPIYKKYNLSTKNIVSFKNKDIVRPILAQDTELPESFVGGLFNLSTKKVSITQQLGYAKYGFAIIQKIAAITERDASIYKQVAEISENNYKNEIYDQYLDYLRGKYSTEINFELINHKFE